MNARFKQVVSALASRREQSFQAFLPLLVCSALPICGVFALSHVDTAASATPNRIFACKKIHGSDRGTIRIVNSSDRCRAGWRPISWLGGAPAGEGGGAVGPQGEQGPAGPSGSNSTVQGPQGEQGEPGEPGVQGEEGGQQGVQGEQGPAGPIGPIGPAGPQGETGATGTQGEQGAAGTQGEQGPAGTQGTQGPAGAQGAQGSQGVQGPAGPQGAAGPGASQQTVVTTAISNNTTGQANCPVVGGQQWYAVGGGGAQTAGSDQSLQNSAPVLTGGKATGWRVVYRGTITGSVYAICLP